MSGLGIRLYTDEDVDARLAVQLRQRGYDVLSCAAAGRAHQRIPDEDQLAFAVTQQRAILSHNIGDFTQLAADWVERQREHHGIIVVEQRISLSGLIRRTIDYLDFTSPAEQYNTLRFLP